MSRRLVLVDSSSWIGYLHGPEEAEGRIDELLFEHRVAINAVIRLEVLTGAKDERQYRELEGAFGGLHFLELTPEVWREVERMRFRLKQRGRVIPVTDVLVASSALIYDCELLHQDRHFDQIARVESLRIHPL